MQAAAPLGIRERRHATTRLALSQAVGSRLAERDLADITVDEIAAAVGVSRVTFFNYFATKEHALDHAFAVWSFHEQCEARRAGVFGIQSILHYADASGRFIDENPPRARRVLAWMAARPVDRPLPELSRAERQVLAPDFADEPIEWARDRLLTAVRAARAAGQLVRAIGSDYEIAHMVGVLIHGAAVVGHSKPRQDWRKLVLHHVHSALGVDMAVDPIRRTRRSPRGAESASRRRTAGRTSR